MMRELLEWVSSADRLVGFIVAMFGISGAIFAWFQRRSRSFVGRQTAHLSSGQARQADRLSTVEQRLDQMDDHMQSLDKRTSQIEARLPSLATREDVAQINIQMAALQATSTQTASKVDTIYRAALEWSGK